MMRTLCYLLCVPALASLPLPALAQPVVQYRSFDVPFAFVNPADSKRFKEVRLYVSEDRGATWTLIAKTKPDAQRFSVKMQKDGVFWYAMQVQDREDKLVPAVLDALLCDLAVNIQTRPLKVVLEPLPHRAGLVGVTWKISGGVHGKFYVVLEYRPTDGKEWIRLNPIPGNYQHFWEPKTKAPMDVRIRAFEIEGSRCDACIRLLPSDAAK